MQEINFYRSLLKPNRYAINAQRAKIILASWIFLLMCVFVLQAGYAIFQYAHFSYLAHQEKKITAQLEILIKNSPKIKYIRKLKNTIQTFSEIINRQSSITPSFKPTDYLKELANATTPQVWLTHIQFQHQGKQIDLAGFTLSTSQLTKFVMHLQNEAHFKNKSFAKIAITHAESQEKIPFILNTQKQKHE